MSFKIVFEHEFSDEDVANLLCCGMEGGINYWARIAEYETPEHFPERSVFGDRQLFPHIDYPIAGGAVLIQEHCDAADMSEDGILVDGDGKPLVMHTLDREALNRGLKVMAAKYPRHFQDFLNEDADATTGDVFVQCCLFGEIVYG